MIIVKQYPIYYLKTLNKVLSNIHIFAQSDEALISTISNLLIVGDAGVGKTHLFCDVAKNRISKKLPTILLLGGHFNNSEPWTQIIQCYVDQFNS